MTILQNTTNAVLPIFLLILCGYVTCAAGGIKREEVGRINRLNFNAFIPALIIYNIHNTKLSTAFRPGLIAYAVLGLLTEACLGWIIARYMVEKREQKGVVIQGLFRTNVTLIGVQLLANLIPNADLGPISIMSAFTVITINTVSVIALETYSGRKTGGKQLLASIVKNPLIIGCLMGVLLLVSDVKLPAAAETTLRDLSRLASPLSLFLLGAFFRFKDLLCHAHPGLRHAHRGAFLCHGAAHGRRCGAGRQYRGDDQPLLSADDLRLVLPVPGAGPVLK